MSQQPIQDPKIAAILAGAGLGTGSVVGGGLGLGSAALFSNPYTAVIGAGLMAAPLIANLFGPGKEGKRKVDSTRIVNEFEKLLKDNLTAYNKSGKTAQETVAYLNRAQSYYDAMMTSLMDPSMGEAGTRGAKERSPGGKYDYTAFYIEPIKSNLQNFSPEEIAKVEQAQNPNKIIAPYQPKAPKYFSDVVTQNANQPTQKVTLANPYGIPTQSTTDNGPSRSSGQLKFVSAPSSSSPSQSNGAFNAVPNQVQNSGTGQNLTNANLMNIIIGALAASQFIGAGQRQNLEQVQPLYPAANALWNSLITNQIGQGVEPYPGELSPDPSKMLLPKVVANWEPQNQAEIGLIQAFAPMQQRHEANRAFIGSLIKTGMQSPEMQAGKTFGTVSPIFAQTTQQYITPKISGKDYLQQFLGLPINDSAANALMMRR